MLISHPFRFQSPQTLEAAFDLLLNHKNSVLFAGGTDYIPLLKYGLKQPAQLIGLDGIPYLKQIEQRKNTLFVGAMTRLQTIEKDPDISGYCSIISDAARQVASPQIRNVGTIGGNICQDRRCIYFNQTQFWRQSKALCFKTGGSVCHQSPRSEKCKAIYHSDLAPILTAVNARVECFGNQGFYELPIQTFINKHSAINGGIEIGKQLITGIILPKPTPKSWMGFVKQSVRESIDFPLLNAAVCYQTPGKDKVRAVVKIIVGAVAPEPIELIESQQMIIEQIETRNISIPKWTDMVLKETRQKSQLILDTGLTLSARKKTFGAIARLIEGLADFLNHNLSSYNKK